MKMATASHLKDIDDNFCICSICLEQLKEPKLLSCLHRYCKDCLDTVVKGSRDTIRCPECREEIQIPANGVDGFKTDFYSKNLVDYVQIQKSLKTCEIRKCYGCSDNHKVAAYCFKCNDFLCTNCHKFHMTNKFLKDHQKHTLSLEDIESKHITIEKLASMRDAPRCNTHLEKISELYCETCDNITVCIACTYGAHRGHYLHEVTELAKIRRQKLTGELKILEKVKQDKNFKNSATAKMELIENASIEKQKLQGIYEDKVQKTKAKITEIKAKIDLTNAEEKNAIRETIDSLRTEMEKEIQEVKMKFDKIVEVKQKELRNAFAAQTNILERELSKYSVKCERFDEERKKLLESIETQLKENTKLIDTISEHFDKMEKRFEIIKVMASGIVSSENDWSAVQCIPDMCTAATNLVEDYKKDFPEMTTLTNVTVNYEQSSFGKRSISKISEKIEKKVTVSNIYHYVLTVTSAGDSNIVISGIKSNLRASFIIVIDMDGKIVRQKDFNSGKTLPFRLCHFLSQHKVATVCQPNEIGLFDVRDGSYIAKNISDVIHSWPKDRKVICIATDPVNNHILVGGYGSRDVYVFDHQLNYLHILTLPEMIKFPQDITVSNGHLLVFDYDRKKSYVTTMNELKTEVVGEFIKPDLYVGDLRPCSVSTDKNGVVYMLWMYGVYGQCYLVQYNHDGSQILTTRKMDDKASVVAVVETSQGEKLLVATYKTQTVYLYGLLDEY